MAIKTRDEKLAHIFDACRRMRIGAANGHYSESQLEQLSSLLLAYSVIKGTSLELVAAEARVSVATVERIAKRRTQPLLNSFLKVLIGLQSACGQLIDPIYASTHSLQLELFEDPEDGSRWLADYRYKRGNETQALVAEAVIALSKLVESIDKSNVFPTSLAAIQRAQLEAILETALKLLQAPVIETGFLKKLNARLQSITARVGEAELESLLSKSLQRAEKALKSLIASLLKNPPL